MLRSPAVALLAVVLLLASCSGDRDQAKQTPPVPQGQVRSTVDVAFQVYDIYGTLQRSGKWIGKQPVVVNFWGTWCPPCRREIPELVKLYNEYYSKGVEILGMAVKDTPDRVSRYASQAQMGWVMLLADDDLRGLDGSQGSRFLRAAIQDD